MQFPATEGPGIIFQSVRVAGGDHNIVPEALLDPITQGYYMF